MLDNEVGVIGFVLIFLGLFLSTLWFAVISVVLCNDSLGPNRIGYRIMALIGCVFFMVMGIINMFVIIEMLSGVLV